MIQSAVDGAHIQRADEFRRQQGRSLARLFVAAMAFVLIFAGSPARSVLASGDAPVATDQSETIREGKPLDIYLASFDNEFDVLTFEVVDPPANGTLDPAECDDGFCTYTPDTGPNFIGTDDFTWRANDGTLDSNLATVTIDVTANSVPVASDQDEITREGKPLQLFLLAEDNDFDELTYTIVAQPTHGDLSCTDGACTYTPDTSPNYIGADSFTWKANDGLADSNVATFDITVTTNLAPQAFDQSEVVRSDTPELIFLLAYDDDFDDLTYAVVDGPAHGSLDDCISGMCTYTPDAAYVGADSFTWKANDGLADSNTATFTFDVAANTAPVASNGSFFAFTNTATPVNLAASDNEGDSLTYAIVTAPAHGDLTDCSSGSCTYTPDAGFVGLDTFTWKASDGLLDSNVATTDVTVGEPLGRVLILDPTVTNGAGSREAQAAAVQGYAADVVNEATWSSMTTAEFDTYAAVILGDPTCGSVEAIAAAEANRATWSPVVDGNVVVIGTDPIFHESQGGGQLTDSAMAYVLAATGTTSLYVTLSCYYGGAEDNTPVPLLDAFGTFEVGHADCFNDAHVVAEHPALAGLDDGDLSGWSCSVHEVFQDWPLNFVVLAIAENFGSVYTAPDGTVGSPYILAAGDISVTSDIDLAPLSATNPIGSSHELTATVSNESGPIAGTTVTFSVIDGPHSGVTGTDVTDALGAATFSYLGTTTGTDTIKATFVDSEERTQTSNLVSKTWVTSPTYLLSVSLAGAGSGSVSSSPVGIDCGSDCSQAYDAGTVVTLTATPATGSDFTGWSGACTGTATCQVTMDAARSVTATFALEATPTYLLSVSLAGAGSGSVSSSPVGIDCGSDCSQAYDAGTVVTLTATPATGSDFTGWSGACTGTATCQVTMDAARSVTATFALEATPTYLLSVSLAGAGSGSVSSSPVGIDCGSDCSQAYDAGTVVTLTATPATGSDFTGWSGACTGTATCQVTMDAARSVTATFALEATPTYLLSVSLAGAGSGSVSSSPVGIDCGSDCSQAYDAGTVVTLTATPATGSDFTGWSGACTGTATCQVTMDAARSVTATFALEATPTYLLSVSLAGAGSGSVSSSPVGIDCGSDCSQAYDAGTVVTLTATPATGSDFTGWSGACTGTATCQVTMDAARSVTATFALEATPTADLSVTQTDSPDPVTGGNGVQYFLTVTNAGLDAATGVVSGRHHPVGLVVRRCQPWLRERFGRGDMHHRPTRLRGVGEYLDRRDSADGGHVDHHHQRRDRLGQRGRPEPRKQQFVGSDDRSAGQLESGRRVGLDHGGRWNRRDQCREATDEEGPDDDGRHSAARVPRPRDDRRRADHELPDQRCVLRPAG